MGYNLIKYLFNWYKVINFAVIKMKKSSGGQLYFREIRKKYGLKQTEISKMVGVSQTYYSLVESRKRVPSMDFVERLAGIYGLPIAVLLWGSITEGYRDWETDRKSTRLNSSHSAKSRMPSSA